MRRAVFRQGEVIAAGRCTILGPLGGGGAGESLRGERSVSWIKTSALKFVALGQADGDPARSRFVSEVAMAREVAHPNVVQVYDIGQLAGGEVFLSMEFIDGEDLASFLHNTGRLYVEKDRADRPRTFLTGWPPRIDHGVLHRDLKPSNIVIDERRSRTYRRFRHRGF